MTDIMLTATIYFNFLKHQLNLSRQKRTEITNAQVEIAVFEGYFKPSESWVDHMKFWY